MVNLARSLTNCHTVIFANRRVLHGRTAFDPTSGDRHLKGTYVELDLFKDKLRVLSEKYHNAN